MTIKIEEDNHYLKRQVALEKADLPGQLIELKRIIPDQSFFKRRIEISFVDDIKIIDRRYSSMSSERGGYFLIRNGATMVEFDPLKKEILIEDSRLFPIIKDFAERWGYKKIRKEYQI